ncbi:helicase SWR1 [Schizosaccharomyces japonicus yFS275]|uniref:DNA helicase n=1 Tax=Schizosaccharomyces japonicus (strain yFS275 / FY16936) TaxID=402676 RepID=B6K0Y0_SCHJY|nr:helicase SWR1 [Schizosaccharomyces japonicus yFS275]EEB07601.2 helicase SWR1 [Schizosaccharomyces japonicus yFS275]
MDELRKKSVNSSSIAKIKPFFPGRLQKSLDETSRLLKYKRPEESRLAILEQVSKKMDLKSWPNLDKFKFVANNTTSDYPHLHSKLVNVEQVENETTGEGARENRKRSRVNLYPSDAEESPTSRENKIPNPPFKKLTMREKYSGRDVLKAAAASSLFTESPRRPRSSAQNSDTDNDEDDEAFRMHEDIEDKWATKINREALEQEVFSYLNTCSSKDLVDMTSFTVSEVELLLSKRPFESLEAIGGIKMPSVQPRRGRRGPRERFTLGQRVVNTCTDLMRGYFVVDELIRQCEVLGDRIKQRVSSWGFDESSLLTGELQLSTEDLQKSSKTFVSEAPKTFSPELHLQNYQVVGMNWLFALYQEGLSGILADEMGLGKTCQTIAFLGLLKEMKMSGPHLVIAPSSTIENWLREINRFCPTLKTELYYGSQAERADLRDKIDAGETGFDILLTTYQLAANSADDRKFLRSLRFNVCVYDEGHYLKNRMSGRYKHLMSIPANFRLLLTGTPLQNNLKELISLLAFILPNVFDMGLNSLDIIFTLKKTADADLERTMLSQVRISRAKSMMQPFVLRRRKAQVLSTLPQKIRQLELCDFSDKERLVYSKNFPEKDVDSLLESAITKETTRESSSLATHSPGFLLMQLRKISNHFLLVRNHYTDELLKTMASEIMKEKTYADANEQYIFEDMQVMTDIELHLLCSQYSSLNRFMLAGEPWMEATKVKRAVEVMKKSFEQGNPCLTV